MMRSLLLCISLLVVMSSDRALCKSVFSSSLKSHMFLRSRRANTFMEEIKLPSLERECREELCDFEEAREIFNTREATLEFWTAYKDGNQCDSNPCVHGMCVDLLQDYSCTCNSGFEGKRCDLRDYDRFKIEGTEMTIPVKQPITHPQYNPFTVDNDIALLRLANPAKFSTYILPACLPSQDLADRILHRNGTITVVTGWGKDNETAHRFSSTLNFIEIPIIDNNECSRHMLNNLTQNMLCGGVLGQIKDACEGDSGGPMMTLFHDTWFLVGLVSWGEGCGQRDKLGIYTKVSSYLDWINSVRQGWDKV